MKRGVLLNIKRLILIIACLLILAASLAAMLAFGWMAGRYYTESVVIVTPRIADVRYHIPRARVEGLAPHFPSHTIVGVTRNRQGLSSDFRSGAAWVYHTSSGYFDLRRVEFIEGTPAHEPGEIVVNEALAWQLFGNTINVTGLSVTLAWEQYIVSGVVCMGSEPAAWRIAAGEPVSALYIRADEQDPLAAATATRIMRNHLFVNPDDYYIIETDRVVQSMDIRMRILMVVVLSGVFIFLFVRVWRAFHVRAYVTAIALLLWLCAAAFFIWFITNGILLWLPNPEAIDMGMFAYIFIPGGPAEIARYSAWVNGAFASGFISSLIIFWKNRRILREPVTG